MSNLMSATRFVRTSWLPAALVVVSTFILIVSGFVGDVVLYVWHRDQRAIPLPPLSEWLALNYGNNESNLLLTHVCFCWAFVLLFVALTRAPLSEFRRRFFTGFVLGWSLIAAFWAFLALCAALPYVRLTTILSPAPAMIPKLAEPFFWGLPTLCIALLAWRLIGFLRERRSV